ncbi:serine/threonine-protein kinase [Nonomuraea glycinis]|uniref:serine/threonine-protein kinase n=1 Tax=Nonomuraea glycinis TaxID=2047744 RepID=UPI002E0FC9E9|nr:serine/threonine protein kinase [Nonomuraea glycinis]
MEPTGAAPLRPTDLREIGPYRLLGRLGEGGMGTVFLARAPTGRFVAVKVVKAEFANQEGFAVRFHAEVENARRVASFCTAQVLDNGNTGDGRPYMVTEYIAGTPMSDQITKYGQLDPGPLHGVALGVAAALAAIHVAELVHRDLKPANVILSLSGPRVIDFGIARALDRETGFTLSGELLGSPGWWAPEQVRGEMVTPAVDIFAWGCLIAYAGNGRHPFGRGDPITLATRVLHTPPDLGSLPAPLDELVRRATAMEPSERPTAQELLLALVGGGAKPAPVTDNPPTLVADELLTDWEPPQNVVDKPDITATFATPPPRDATRIEQPAAEISAQGSAQSLERSPVHRSAQGPEQSPAQSSVRSLEQSPAQSSVQSLEQTQEQPKKQPRKQKKQPPEPPQEPQVSAAELARREEAAAREELASWQASTAPPEVRPTPTIPPPDDATGPTGQRPRGTRWLIAAAAALLAITVTGAVLIVTSSRNNAGSGVTATASQAAADRPNDVGRRFALGEVFDDPMVIVSSAPECGLKEFQDKTQTQGQLCVVRWTMVNPGGKLREIGDPVVSMRDDRGARHDPLDGPPPVAAIAPGDRIDGVFVFDVPLYRRPVELSATMLKDGKQIEVKL